MKSSTATILSGLFLGLVVTQAHAGDQSQQPPLPQSYDVPAFTQTYPNTTASPAFSKDSDDPAQPSKRPADGAPGGTSIEWSAEVQTGVIYRGSRTR